MEESLHEVSLFREFADLTGIRRCLTRLRSFAFADCWRKASWQRRSWRGSGKVVDATLIVSPSSTKNASGECDPQMKQSKKGNQWFFGIGAHIGVD